MSTPFLSVGELALFLGIGEKWCYQALSEGAIPGSFKIKGRWFIDRQKLTLGLDQLSYRPTKKVRPNGDDPHGLTA